MPTPISVQIDYRMRVYAPRSVDPNENTVLTPPPGASHNLPFQVTTVRDLPGWQPLMGVPQGRRGDIGAIDKKLGTSNQNITITDRQTGGTQAQRFLAAYRNMLGLKALIQERVTTNGVPGPWQDYAVGRIQKDSPANRAQGKFEIRDIVEDMRKVAVFVEQADPQDDPQVGVMSWVPLGLTCAYGGTPAITPIRGRLSTWRGTRRIKYPDYMGQPRTPYFSDATAPYELNGPHCEMGEDDILRMRITGPPQYAGKEFRISWIKTEGFQGEQRYIEFEPETLPSSDPRALNISTLPDGTDLFFFVYRSARESDGKRKVDFWIEGKTPVQMIQDLCAGKYGRKNAAGLPISRFPVTVSPALANDPSLPATRWHITEPGKLLEWMQKNLLQPYGLGLVIRPGVDPARGNTPSAVVEIVDMRLATVLPTLGVLPQITDADLIAEKEPGYERDRAQALSTVAVKYYNDLTADWRELVLNRPYLIGRSDYAFPSGAKEPVENTAYLINGSQHADASENGIEIDARGTRGTSARPQGQIPLSVVAANQAAEMAKQYRAFQDGPEYITLYCLRSDAVQSCWPGSWRQLAVSSLPNHITGERGGTRLALCTQRQEEGLGIRLTFLGMGEATGQSNGQRLPPNISNLTLNAFDRNGAEFDLFLNGANDPCEVQLALTDSTASEPPASSPLWTPTRLYSSGFAVPLGDLSKRYQILGLPPGQRIWVRARSVSRSGDTSLLPSAWTASLSLQMTLIPAPTGLTTSGITSLAATVSWANPAASAQHVVEVQFGDPAGALRTVELAPGTTTYQMTALGDFGPSTLVARVRYKAPNGDRSEWASTTFDRGAAGSAPTGPALRGFAVSTT